MRRQGDRVDCDRFLGHWEHAARAHRRNALGAGFALVRRIARDDLRALLDHLGAARSPVKTLINTHWHWNHTGANELLGKAGVPIMRALAGLQESTTNKTFSGVIKEVRESLDAGRELSPSLARQPRIFSPFYVSMVRVGEMTGQLEEVFLRMFHHLEFEKFMREQVKSALRYPSFVVMAMGLAMVVVNLFVIPQFAKVLPRMALRSLLVVVQIHHEKTAGLPSKRL